MEIEVSEEAPAKAACSIDVTLDGMLMEVNAVAPMNASEPMLVTLDGMDTDVSELV